MSVSKNTPFALAVFGVLIVLTILFLGLGYLEYEREQELARLAGDDELARTLRTELDEYRNANRSQQLGVAATGAAVLLAAGGWWVWQRRGRNG